LKIFCTLTAALIILRFHLTLWTLDDIYFHFCDRIYDLECGRKSGVSVRLLVCCVVKTLKTLFTFTSIYFYVDSLIYKFIFRSKSTSEIFYVICLHSTKFINK